MKGNIVIIKKKYFKQLNCISFTNIKKFTNLYELMNLSFKYGFICMCFS